MKRLLIVVLVLAVGFTFASCGKKKAKIDTPGVETPSDTGDLAIDMANKALDLAKIGPFASGKAKVPKAEWDKYIDAAAKAIEGALTKTPDGYGLYVVGHTDNKGGKKGNLALSKRRAQAVFLGLRKKGIKDKKLKFKGVGFDELDSGCDAAGDCQRRVSFKILKDSK